MSNSDKQIFQTEKKTRWKGFMWIVRILGIILTLATITFLTSLLIYTPPKLEAIKQKQQKIRRLTNQEMRNSFSQASLKAFGSDLARVRAKNPGEDLYRKRVTLPNNVNITYPIRAGFYVNWDPASRTSLEFNASELNMVLPEWLFINDSTDLIETRIDSIGLDIMRKEKVAIIPMISNFSKGAFNGKNVNRILSSPAKRAQFIKSIIKVLDRYKFQGINLDLENLDGQITHANFHQFIIELKEALHPKNYLLTQDIEVSSSFYDVHFLAKHVDYLFLMGYDQFNKASLPGPIAAQKWVEELMNEEMLQVSPEKWIICLPTYGYDWPFESEGTPITYQRAISLSAQHKSSITFNNDTYNLNFSYTDDTGLKHIVYFVDATSNYNAMRAASDFGAAGVALWRLGAEDTRIWDFYAQDVLYDAIQEDPIDFNLFSSSKVSYSIDYTGSGEIYEVKNLPQAGKIKFQVDTTNLLISEEIYEQLPTTCIVNKSGLSNANWIAFTFDDGPNEDYTPAILDILSKYKVRASFFVIGNSALENLSILERMYKEGHSIGNHTFTHTNLNDASDERTRIELRTTNRVIEAATGHTTQLFRSPYTAEPTSIEEFLPIYRAKEEGFYFISSSYDPRDWEPNITPEEILKRIATANRFGNIVLMHDGGGDRQATVAALPMVIEYFKKNGYTFVTIEDLIGKSRDELMPKASKDYVNMINDSVVETTFYWEHILYTLFLVTLILSITKMGSMFTCTLAARHKEKKRSKSFEGFAYRPLVSVIVPAYNEEVNILKSLDNQLKADYPNYEIIFVDDGSKDSTYSIVKARYATHPKIRVYTKPNGGKASALNFGITQAEGDILVCIDADTVLKSDAISLMIKQFSDNNVAAVAGNVKVGNRINLLTHWQSIEYISSQNFDRRAFDYLNSIMVIPGAIGAFRKAALNEIGGFDTDTLAEDCDLTLRLLSKGYRIRNCNEALSYTEAPEALNQFYKQRFRWSYGIMQSFWKHKEQLFSLKNPNMGWVILPNVLVFQMILPLFGPLVDISMIYSIITGNTHYILEMYLLFMLIDTGISAMAFHFDHEQFTLKTFGLFVIQRILYRQIMWYILIKAYLKAIKGEMASWGVLKRTGNVKDI